jgi:hypothetical protein
MSQEIINIIVEEFNENVNITISEIGIQGPPGIGIPSGGTTGQILTKVDNTNYNTQWSNAQLPIINEVPNGLINGSNVTFTTDFNFTSGTVQLFLNGTLQKIIDDYQVIGNDTILLNTSPIAGENLLINYIKL